MNVQFTPYQEVKAAALDELRKLYSGPQTIESNLAKDIVSEMAAAEYQWAPGLGDLENLPSELEKSLARFFLGGLIFAGYAQMLGGEHVMQPKRSRLFLAASLKLKSDSQFEEELFGELKRRATSSIAESPWRPTFLPYLLSSSPNPMALLANAFVLRQSSEVREYKQWLRTAKVKWERDGSLGSITRELRSIATAIDRRIAGDGSMPTVELKVDVADVVALGAGIPKIPGSVDFKPTLSALWGWCFANLPGRRYRKLLIRAIASDRAYSKIENRIKSVWRAAG